MQQSVILGLIEIFGPNRPLKSQDLARIASTVAGITPKDWKSLDKLQLINRHVLYDVWVEDRTLLATVEPLQDLLCWAAKSGGATVLHSHFHQFDPHGVTGFILLAESHISIHTWVD